jgi:hypothetical protein
MNPGEPRDWRGVPKGAFIGPVVPHAGVGAPSLQPFSVLASDAAPPLETLGDDVVRFSSSPPIAKRAFIIELHRRRNGLATGTVTIFTIGTKRWERVDEHTFSIAPSELGKLEGSVDVMLAEPLRTFCEGEACDNYIACLEGAYFLTERLHAGQKTWLSGDYGPNYRIAKALVAAAGDQAFDPAPPQYCGERD